MVEEGFALDINTVIFIFLSGGIALHGAPVNYVDALGNAARSTLITQGVAIN